MPPSERPLLYFTFGVQGSVIESAPQAMLSAVGTFTSPLSTTATAASQHAAATSSRSPTTPASRAPTRPLNLRPFRPLNLSALLKPSAGAAGRAHRSSRASNSSAGSGAGRGTTPPVLPQVPYHETWHGQSRVDEYHWLTQLGPTHPQVTYTQPSPTPR